MKHTIGVEVNADLSVYVWGFCPYTEEERLEGRFCSEMVRVDLPPEPLPRPTKVDGVWRLPCHNCSGTGSVMSSGGYPRPVRCAVCAGSGWGYEVSQMNPWFRWAELPKREPSGRCVVELYPNEMRKWARSLTSKVLPGGKLVNMIDFDYAPEDFEQDPTPVETPELRIVENEWRPPTEAEWAAIVEREHELDIRHGD